MAMFFLEYTNSEGIVEKRALELNQIVVGRQADSDIVLDEPDISRHHAKLLKEGEAYLIIDLDSANGTWVNGKRIVRRKLEPGDKINLSDLSLRYVCDELSSS